MRTEIIKGILILFAMLIILLSFITHIVYCLAQGLWIELSVGSIFFPYAVGHGFILIVDYVGAVWIV